MKTQTWESILSNKRILVVPNAFKGIASSPKVARLLKGFLGEKGFIVKSIPLADGGDGSLDILEQHVRGKKFFSYALNAGGRRQQVPWIVKGKTAYIEMSRICGWKQKHKYESGLDTSSFGLGEVILYAINMGIKQLNIFIGGSASVDGGAGMLGGMGAPWGWVTARTLYKIEPFSESIMNFKGTFNFYVDVKNKFKGEDGVLVYAPQKGIRTEDEFEILNKNLEYWEMIVKNYNSNASDFSGAGAGGGVPYAAKNILGANIHYGSEYFIKLANIEKEIEQSDIIITGEARWDKTSLMGKLTGEIVKLAEKHKKPYVIICGEKRTDEKKDNVYSIRDKQNIRLTHLQRRIKKSFQEFAEYIENEYK